MAWHVLTGRALEETARERLDSFATFTVAESLAESEELDAIIGEVDGIILGGISLPAARLERASQLKVVTSPGVGVDAVDLSAATEQGILVCNNPGANTRAVAEYMIAAMFAVRRGLRQADRDVRAGEWDKYGYVAPELEDQLLGVVGYGAIGREVTTLAEGLGMQPAAYDPHVDEEDMAAGVTAVGSALELCETADVVSIHAPLTPETRGLIGEAELAALGRDGIIVNAARGGIVDEAELAVALEDEVIAGAAIDVFDEEPPPADHPFFELENVLVSPHMAGSTQESVPAKDRGAVENLKQVYEGRLPDSTVNRDELCLKLAYDGTPPAADLDPEPF